jgi:hypothetical protein
VDQSPREASLQQAGKSVKVKISPNEVWNLESGEFVLAQKVPFDYPYSGDKHCHKTPDL